MYYVLKIVLSSLLLVALAEIGKRSSFWGAILASLPTISIFAFIWIFIETQDKTKIADLSSNIVWLVLPSLILFALLPILLRHDWNFWLALLISCLATAGGYSGMFWFLKRWGIAI